VIVWAFWQLQDPQLMPVNNVKVEGHFQFVDRAKIEALLEPLVAQGFLAVDVNAIRKQLRNEEWVDDVSVYRVWPDTLVIKIVEQSPQAIWRHTEIVNDKGKVFHTDHVPEQLLETLPSLAGPPDQIQEVLWHYKEINRRLSALGLHLQKLNLTDRFAWEGVLNNGFELILGRSAPLERLDRFIKAYPVFIQKGEIDPARIDLRYTNGFAIAKLQ
jgi:cell division protein FtsQ